MNDDPASQCLDIAGMKSYILNYSKDLDKNDYIDICKFLHMTTTDHSMITFSKKGTYINLDQLSKETLAELYTIVHTKLVRIKSS